MRPILYASTEAAFDTNGLGILSDAISCRVTEERNGAFELEMVYPVEGIHYSEIKLRCIVFAKPNPTDDAQPFRIYNITKPMDGRVTVSAEHISYDLSGIPVSPFTALNAPEAAAGLKNNSAVSNPFTFWTDITTVADFSVSVPSSVRSLLGGREGSLLDVYGGEYRFDRYIVRLYAWRGQDRGVTIRYGKNLTSLEQEENCSNVYTGIYPYWADTDGNTVELAEKIVNAPGTYNFERIMPLDLSSEFDERPTEAQLRAAAQAYAEDNDIGIPSVSLEIGFVQLEQTEEYKHLALLERVDLCDTVRVIFPALGVEAEAKCVKTVYDVLLDRYESIELGDSRVNIADTIAQQQKDIERVPNKSFVQAAVENATALITGNRGGYVVLHSTSGGKEPDEILVMNTDDIKTATKVWRWNTSGLGYSGTGYNGPYGLAMTMDGAIVADFITAGTLNAALANVINLNASNVTTGTLKSSNYSYTSGTFSSAGTLFDVATGMLRSKNFAITATGELIAKGQFQATKTSGSNTYNAVLENGGLYFYKNGSVIAQFEALTSDGKEGYMDIHGSYADELQCEKFYRAYPSDPGTMTSQPFIYEGTAQVNAGTGGAASVSFGGVFTQAPIVMATWASADAGEYGALRVHSITASGCTISASGSYPTTDKTVHWVAFGL